MMKPRRNITISILALVVVVGMCLPAWGFRRRGRQVTTTASSEKYDDKVKMSTPSRETKSPDNAVSTGGSIDACSTREPMSAEEEADARTPSPSPGPPPGEGHSPSPSPEIACYIYRFL